MRSAEVAHLAVGPPSWYPITRTACGRLAVPEPAAAFAAGGGRISENM